MTNTTEQKPFWMIWNPAGNVPTFRHDSERSAELEAERLARLNPEQFFVILQAVGARQVSSMQKIRFTPDCDIPF